MSNLEKALTEVSSADADKVLNTYYTHAKKNERYYYRIPEALRSFIAYLATQTTGYSHGSDYFDAGAWEGDYSSETFDSYDQMSDIKEEFANKVMAKIDSFDMKTLPSFDNLYDDIKESGFNGTKEELEQILKTSNVFSEAAYEQYVRYDG